LFSFNTRYELYFSHSIYSMSYPPVEWDILPDDEFGGHLAPESTRPLTAVVLLQTDGGAKADNNFRVALGGSELLVYKGPVSSFLSLEEEDNTSISIQSWPRDIQLAYNSMCGGWFDLEHGIAAQDITVTPVAQGDDAGNVFRAKLAQDNSRSAVGAAFRWAVNASFQGKLELQLQCLPLPAGRNLTLDTEFIQSQRQNFCFTEMYEKKLLIGNIISHRAHICGSVKH
jgi:hypothetical protein